MQTCDILIVGGGVMGVSIAHALAQRRVGRIVVLEKAYLGAVQFVASVAEAATRHGVEIRQGVEVKSLLLDGDRVAGVETNEGRYNCKTVILATGPWAARLAEEIGIRLPVQACRTQVA